MRLASCGHGHMMNDLLPWRLGQEDAVHRILQAFRFTKNVILCAPPGSGKSVVAVAVARALGARTLILTGTKALQQRYATAPTNLPPSQLVGKTTLAHVCPESTRRMDHVGLASGAQIGKVAAHTFNNVTPPSPPPSQSLTTPWYCRTLKAACWMGASLSLWTRPTCLSPRPPSTSQ